MKTDQITDFVVRQLAAWPDARDRHAALSGIMTKSLTIDGVEWSVLCNPSRSVSTKAKVDSASIGRRPCFLCRDARPVEQMSIPWGDYEICVNPFPVYPQHLTIISKSHRRQEIMPGLAEMVALARELEGYTVFYNGPSCGASAPDHAHFQGVPHRFLPIDRKYPFRTFYRLSSGKRLVGELNDLLSTLPVEAGEWEPRVNIAMHALSGEMVEAVVIPRKAHRPRCYGELAVSPGAIDMLGAFVTTDKHDYDALDDVKAREIIGDVSYLSPVPDVKVGIMTAPDINYTLHGRYREEKDTFVPEADSCLFDLSDVTIGIGFHWEQRETQTFSGALRLMRTGEGVTAINILPVEDYLSSVISSEMSASASFELLKAHAVISRSWVLAQIRGRDAGKQPLNQTVAGTGEIVKWYDHDDHKYFDVCADDHCQRYQGVTRIKNDMALKAVKATCGEVLMSQGELCDARFSKCCGGAFEEFETCWEPRHHDYLEAGRDILPSAELPDLTDEAVAHDWIMSRPDAFCCDVDSNVLRQVLNDYDLATGDFYRWAVHYTAEELSRIVRLRSGYDFGMVTGLRPLQRGKSGRISRLEITGTKLSMIVGKELEIRRWLSMTHLYSSAFVPVRTADGFTLYGAGWGHGVGLCQIGAAVMGERGYDYRQILTHYFKNAEIKQIY